MRWIFSANALVQWTNASDEGAELKRSASGMLEIQRKRIGPDARPCLARERRALGNAAGLSQFGINQLRLPPGRWSNQRHWHPRDDGPIYAYGDGTP